MTFGLLGTVVRDLTGEAWNAVRQSVAARVAALLPDPVPTVPAGFPLDLPGGRTYVVDAPGPSPDAPTVVLLHGLTTTGVLTWYTAFAPLAEHYRVISLDLRWHGRGIASDRFRLDDCADDVADVLDALGVDQVIAAGYSLGGAVAQTLWRRHPDRVAGLVLCSTASAWKVTRGEQLFYPALDLAMLPLSRLAVLGVRKRVNGLPDLPSCDSGDLWRWGITEVRSTSPWTTAEVLAELSRFDARPWLGEIDVPTCVVVTETDRAVPPERQLAMAEGIAGSRVLRSPGGHVSLLVDSRRWLPLFLEAVADVADRAADATSPRRAGSATSRGTAG